MSDDAKARLLEAQVARAEAAARVAELTRLEAEIRARYGGEAVAEFRAEAEQQETAQKEAN